MSKKTSSSKHFLVIILLLFLFNGSLGQRGASSQNTCKNNAKINNKECFTDIILFNQKDYRSGHSVITKNGDLIIEYSRNSEYSERLFYGIKSDGSSYFPNNSFIKVMNLTEDGLGKPRYESINYILINNNEENLFSISSSGIEQYSTENIEFISISEIDIFKTGTKFYLGFETLKKINSVDLINTYIWCKYTL